MIKQTLRSLGLVAVIVGAAACRRSTAAPREHPAIVAVTSSASARRASATAPLPSATPAAVARSKKARRIEVAGLDLGDLVAGQQPGAAHPKGTVIALGHAERGRGSVRLVEIDVATGTEVKRSKVTVDGTVRLVREGDALHIGAASNSSFIWLTMDLGLEETRRITPKTNPTPDGLRTFEAFTVLGGNAVIVSSARGAVATILDEHGKTLARHDCRANVHMHGLVELQKTGSLAIIVGLVSGDAALACGVHGDGTGGPIRNKLTGLVFTHDGVAYTSGAEIHRLDRALSPVGPAIPDPRPCSDPRSSCATACADGVSGDAAVDMLMMSDVLVVRTVGCCGGPPGGLFFCDPSAQVSAKR